MLAFRLLRSAAVHGGHCEGLLGLEDRFNAMGCSFNILCLTCNGDGVRLRTF